MTDLGKELDWAQIIANELLDGSEQEALTIFSTESDRDKIAAALRKVATEREAKGMREAANLADDLAIHELGWGEVANYIDDLRRRIVEIEKGTEEL